MMSNLLTETSKVVQHSQIEAITSPNEKMGEVQIIEQAKEATAAAGLRSTRSSRSVRATDKLAKTRTGQ